MKKCLLYLAIALLLAIPQPALAQNLNLGQGMVSVDIETPDDGYGAVKGIDEDGVDVEMGAKEKEPKQNTSSQTNKKEETPDYKPGGDPVQQDKVDAKEETPDYKPGGDPVQQDKVDANDRVQLGNGLYIDLTDDGTKEVEELKPPVPTYHVTETSKGGERRQHRRILHWEWEFVNLTDSSVPTMTAQSLGAELRHIQRFVGTGEWLCTAVPYCRWDIGYYEQETTIYYYTELMDAKAPKFGAEYKEGEELYRETITKFVKTGEEEGLYPPGEKQFKVYIHAEDVGKDIELPPLDQGDLGVVGELVK